LLFRLTVEENGTDKVESWRQPALAAGTVWNQDQSMTQPKVVTDAGKLSNSSHDYNFNLYPGSLD